MAIYTEANLKAVIDNIITANGSGAITGALLNDVLNHIVDSCVNKLSNSGGSGGDTIYSNVITMAQLDVDNAILIPHNLATFVPLVAIWNANNEILSGIHYSVSVVDAASIEITFEDPPEEGETYKLMVWKKLGNITENLDYIDVLTINFVTATYEGVQYHRQPVGWSSYTTFLDGTLYDYLSSFTNFNDDGIAYGMEAILTTPASYYLVLKNNSRYVEAGETYRVQMTGGSYTETGTQQVNVCGQVINFNIQNFTIDAEITVTETGLFYFKFNGAIDGRFFIRSLTVTKQ
jgi:hypothetical protein